MKKKWIKRLVVAALVIVCLGVTTFCIDYHRVKSGLKAIFVIKEPGGIKDGGTKIYYGIGYKVIDYNVMFGRNDTVIGSWFLKYNSGR